MKTLILNGSPRQNGDTAALLSEFTKHLVGDVKIISHADRISPCYDCRMCKTFDGCMINDAMETVYEFLEDCDNVVIASPVWFSSLSGPLLTMASRFQPFFCAKHFRGEDMQPERNGVVILVGGQKGTEIEPLKSARIILSCVNVKKDSVIPVLSMNTDEVPAAEDTAALEAARNAALTLNERWNKAHK